MRCRYREITVQSGPYIDVKIMPVFSDEARRSVQGKRRPRFRPTSEAQQRLNEYNALRQAGRIIEENFSCADVMLTPTFRDTALPQTDEEMMRTYNNFVRRLRRKYRQAGKELKIFTVMGKGEESGRYHIHLIVNGGVLTDEDLRETWGKGRLGIDPLEFDENGLTGLSNYMGKHRLLTKRFFHSRNLRIPQAKESDRRYSQREAAALAQADDRETWEKKYLGYRLIRSEPYFNPVDARWYISLRLWKPPARWLKEAKADGRLTPEEYKRWRKG